MIERLKHIKNFLIGLEWPMTRFEFLYQVVVIVGLFWAAVYLLWRPL